MNKYLTKIAESLDRAPYEYAAAPANAAIYGLIGQQLAKRVVGSGKVGQAVGATIGGVGGLGSALARAGRNTDIHQMKLEAAKQRQEFHEARMRKMASEKDPNQLKKDLTNVGVIATMGGLGNTIADRIVHGPSAGGGTKAFLVGTGVGLGADYIGVKINNAINKQIDKYNTK